jgi:hypothetical protein
MDLDLHQHFPDSIHLYVIQVDVKLNLSSMRGCSIVAKTIV